jgi:endonuclease G
VISRCHVFATGRARGSGANSSAGGPRRLRQAHLRLGRPILRTTGPWTTRSGREASGSDGAQLSIQVPPLIASKGKALKGDPVNIIQHPEGAPKQYATVNNQLLDLRDDGFLLYETDTLEGSSGSPVFNRHWETIGLHHCGVPQMEGGLLVTQDGRRVPPDAEVADSDLIWIANEGVRISAIVQSLASRRLDNPVEQQILDRLLSATVDPLTLVPEAGPVVPAAADGVPLIPATASPAMTSTLFQFTGPVTIVVRSDSPADHDAGRLDAHHRGGATGCLGLGWVHEKALRFDENTDGATTGIGRTSSRAGTSRCRR